MTPEVAKAFRRIRTAHAQTQHAYWQPLTPRTPEDRFRRWLFAFCSVHTTWTSNVRGYQALQDLRWLRWLRGDRSPDLGELCRRLVAARVGLHATRTVYISKFTRRYWRRPEWYTKRPDEAWQHCRNRICDKIAGLGYAKTSFALELIYPVEAEIVCLDVHMLRLYGQETANGRSGKRFATLYHSLEADWLRRCRRRGIPSYIARCVYWDCLQKKPDSRYWSHCLELCPNTQIT